MRRSTRWLEMNVYARAALAFVLAATAACEAKKPTRPPAAKPPVVIHAPDELVRLAHAYPEQIGLVSVSELVLVSGAHIPYRNGHEAEPYDLRLAQASLEDQMSMPYPAGANFPQPTGDNDPGRLRHVPFFQ